MENNIKSITNDRICDYLLCELNTDNRLRKLTKFLISLGTLNIRKSNGESLLSIPIGDRDPTVFDFILENGGDLSLSLDERYNLLMIAIKKGDNYALETLIKRYGYKGIDFNTKVDKETPLFLASRLGQNECVKTLIEYGADTEIEGCGEQTPLDVINRNRYVETFKTLYNKKHDAKVNYE